MSKQQNALSRLQLWYLSQCNGDWEHTYGVEIANIDNPGWSVKVELTHTLLEEVSMSPTRIQRKHEDDWINCRVEKRQFLGYGGPENLEEILKVFLDWAAKVESSSA